jgi:hypothetical protein
MVALSLLLLIYPAGNRALPSVDGYAIILILAMALLALIAGTMRPS